MFPWCHLLRDLFQQTLLTLWSLKDGEGELFLGHINCQGVVWEGRNGHT